MLMAIPVLVMFTFIVVAAGIKIVPYGYQWAVERFDRFTPVLKPGLNLVVPFINLMGCKINMIEQV